MEGLRNRSGGEGGGVEQGGCIRGSYGFGTVGTSERSAGCRKGLRWSGSRGEEMFCSIESMHRRLHLSVPTYLRTSV